MDDYTGDAQHGTREDEDMAAIDPIDRPNFNPYSYRPANKDTMRQLNALGEAYRDALAAAGDIRRELEEVIRDAKNAGHSYPQVSSASGLSIAVIQRIMEKD